MQLFDFIDSFSFDQKLNDKQIHNLERVKSLSQGFHMDAGTLDPVKDLLDEVVSGETVVLESGHQPNFLPHSGTWKKIYLLDLIAGKLREQGKSVLPLFGFADLNISTPSLLYKNKVPAFTKDGCMKIGFQIKGEDRSKPFCLVDKPSRGEWDKELGKLRDFYLENARLSGVTVKGNLDEMFSVLDECYGRANNFADLNSFIYSKVCNKVWGLNVLFYRYSDVQRESVFVDEAYRVYNSVDEYNRLYNEAVDSLGVGLSRVDSGSYPFWFHCDCGIKIPLRRDMKCLSCGREYSLGLDESDIRTVFHRLDYSAVCRDLVYAEGLGTSLFLSGSGGSLRYGQVSDYVGGKLGFHRPVTLGVGGRDYYLGVVHQRVLREFTGLFDLSMDDLLDETVLESRIKEVFSETRECLEGNPGEEAKYRGRLVSYSNQLSMINKVFGLVPSVLDLFVYLGLGGVSERWGGLSDSLVEGNKVDCSLSYDGGLVVKDSVPKLYGILSSLEVNDGVQ